MKKISSLFLFLPFIISCSNDFKVGASYKEVMVVFGLMSQNDTAHYIKITKGFFDEKQNNLDVAKIEDSLYYTNLSVKVEELNASTVVNTYTLDKVNLLTEGYTKDTGIFINNPNYAYKFKFPFGQSFNPNNTYKLVITNASTGKIVYATTGIVNTNPNNFILTNPADVAFGRLNFAKPEDKTSFQWKAPQNGAFFDIGIRFNYVEKNTLTNTYTDESKEIILVFNKPVGIINTGENMVAIGDNSDFYSQLNAALGPIPANRARYVDTPDFFIYAGGQELKTYLDVTTAQGGITYDQIRPNYTNMQGDYALGIFSSRGRRMLTGIPFTPATFDSIIHGSRTTSLGFAGMSPH